MLFRCLLLVSCLLWSSSLLAAKPGKKRTKPPARRSVSKQTTPAPKKTASSPKKKPPVNNVSFGSMVFTVKDGKIKSIQQLSVEELMRQGYKHFSLRKYKVAEALYKRMLKLFPMHRHRFAALYNLALCLEEQRRFKEAIGYFQKFVDLYTEKKSLILNARFRIASCHAQLKQWKKAFVLYDKILQLDLSAEDRYEALAYAGQAKYELGKWAQARPLLVLAVRLFQRQPVQKRSVSYAVSMAQYYIGRMEDKKFRKQGFHFPLERLKRDLDKKALLLLSAQKEYLRTIRLGSVEWAMASLYSIGRMYEQLYHDMMGAPYPKGLSKVQKAAYTRLLKNRIKNLLRKAMWLYKHSLSVAKRLGLQKGQWSKKSEESLKGVFAFYRKTFGENVDGSKIKQPTSRPASQPAKTATGTTTPAPAIAPKTPPPAPRKAPTAAPTTRPAAAPSTQPAKR